MAGYMTIVPGNIYKGTLTNGETDAIENGTLMVMDTTGTKLVLPTADTVSKFTCTEVTTIFDGMAAYGVHVAKLDKEYFFVENQTDVNTSTAYDTRLYSTAAGELLRAHPLHVGDEFVVTCPSPLTVGTSYGVTAAGKIA